MADLDNISPETKERIERIGSADLVIGLPACHTGDALEEASCRTGEFLSTFAGPPKTVLVHSQFNGIPPEPRNSEQPRPWLLGFPWNGGDPLRPPLSPPNVSRSLFGLSQML